MKIVLRLLLIVSMLALFACGGGQNTRPQQSAKESKDASDINVKLAIGYIHRKQYDVAKFKLDKAIEQNEENVEAYKTLAFLLALLGENSEAEKAYLDALDIKTDDPEIHNSYGTFLCSTRRIDAALKSFKKAYSNPYYDTPYLSYSNAGTCLLKQRKYAEAEVMLRKALSLQPKQAGALLSMAELGIRARKFLMARAYIQRYHGVRRPSAESLWIQTQAERALGDREHYTKYAKQLLNDFPDSREAGQLQEQLRNERIRLF